MVEAVQVVFDEVERIAAAIKVGGLESVSREDALYHLPNLEHPGFIIICGRKADTRISELARQATTVAGIERRVSHKQVKKALRSVLVRKFMIEARAIEIGQVERSLSEAARVAVRECKTTTHFIPCHLMLVQKPDTFTMGPVRFLTRKKFRSEIANYVWNERRGFKRDREIFREVLSYYKNFSWVAEVTIGACDAETSDIVAQGAVTSALDCLQLLLGPAHSRKMRVGGPNLQRDKRGGVKVGESGLELQLSLGGPGHVGYDENWFERFEREDYRHALHLCGLALEAATQPNMGRPLSRRFLDAVRWFGEAVREEAPAARVVKYVTALERMLMTEENESISKLISERVAAVCFAMPSAEDFERWHANTQRTYSLRSKLVHGSLSPNAPEIMDQLGMVALVSSMGVQGGLALIGEKGLLAENVSTASLASFYDRTVAHCRSMFAAQEN